MESQHIGYSNELIRLRAENARLRMENEALNERLVESGRELEKFFLDNPLPMWVYDLETLEFLEVNRTAIQKYGYSREQFLSMNLTDIRPAEDVERMLDSIGRQRRGFDCSGNWRHLLANGDLIHVEVASHTIMFHGRRAVLVAVHDISDRRRLEADLRQAQRMEAVGRLASGIAHDFNNFLLVIAGHCELLKRTVQGDAPVERRITLIQDAVERAKSLTEQLLAFSRKPRHETSAVSLNAVVTTVHAMLEQVIGDHIAVNLDLADGLGDIEANPTNMEQLVLNLCLNARDAMPDGGTLSIETRNRTALPEAASGKFGSLSGELVELSVTDTGCGMTEETLERIFDPFFSTKGDHGTGLGLSIAYGIVTRNGGEIHADSRPGDGSRFTITFPRTANARPELPVFKPAIKAVTTGGTVLIVEDEAAVREILVETFELEGYTVLEAEDGEAALRMCDTYPGQLDLLVTDLALPTLNGHDLAKTLTARFPDMDVLFVTGYADQSAIESGHQILQKPFFLAQLVETVGRIRDSRARKER